MNTSLKEEIESIFRDVLVIIPEDARLIVTAKKEQILTILSFLKDKGFDHLALISCVDWIEEKEFELVYIVTSYPNGDGELTSPRVRGDDKLHIILKTRVPRENPEFKTAIPIFKNVEPYERELHESFGINFEGHPRLTHLLLDRDYEIPPFRKDFDTRKYVEEFFDKIPFVEAEKK
jgi:NADH-quinone oxidoreductase subunit C